LLLFNLLGFAQYAFSQSIEWERIHDISNGTDFVDDLAIQDTSTFFCKIYSDKHYFFYPNGQGRRAAIYSFNSRGSIADTFVFPDTVLNFYNCLDRSHKRLWMIYHNETRNRFRLILQKINFQGFTLVRRDFWPDGTIPDSLPYTIIKLVPSQDGGFYLLATMDRRIGTQSSEQWQVSRWDSLGNRRWVKEYLYTYAFGQPQQAEFLPNGNLFVSGWAGREIMALEIDTATGRALNRKVLYTHPDQTGWLFTDVSRSPGGYLIAAEDQRSNTNRTQLHCKVNDSLRVVWGDFSTKSKRFITPLADSSFWISSISEGSVHYYKYCHFTKDSVLLHEITLPNNLPQNSFPAINAVGHFNDLSAVFGGQITNRATLNSALYLCKIDSIGTPYNPVYPPVGPVPVATKNRIVEPDLQVFPNPFTHTLRISHKGTMQLLDIHGCKVMAQAVEAGQEINTGSLPRGMYLLRFTSTAGKGYVRKVVKE